MKIYKMIPLIVLVVLFSLKSVQAKPNLFVSANNAVLIDQSTGKILFEKKAHEKQSIASITKVMTAIIAIEQGDLEDEIIVSKRATHVEGSSIYLTKDEKISLEDLLYGLMLRSGNDAAIAISEHIGGSVEGFVYLMNEKAKWLGMMNTNFENPHGLESDNHYSTAYDMAILYKYAMENKTFQEISESPSYLSSNRAYTWFNKNKLLTKYYKYCNGGKTGFTKRAGRTLVTSAYKNGITLIAVTLNAPDDWKDHIRMFEWGFTQYDIRKITENNVVHQSITDLDHSFYKIFFHQFKKMLGLINYD